MRVRPDWHLSCSCGEVFKSNIADEAVRLAKKHVRSHHPDAIEWKRVREEKLAKYLADVKKRSAEREEWLRLRSWEVRKSAFDRGPRTTRDLMEAWHTSRTSALRFLHRLEKDGKVHGTRRESWPYGYDWGMWEMKKED